MKLVACLVLLFSTFSFGQNYPYISELRGLEDSLNNTHLFYRYVYPTTTCWSKSIYHFDLKNNIDTLFVMDQGNYIYPYGCYGISFYDYEFFSSDPTKYICVGVDYDVDPWVAILRYDGPDDILYSGYASEIEISGQNENLLYMTINERELFKSTDGGYDWMTEQDSIWIDYAMISLSDNNDSQIYGINNTNLVRSEDDGYSYVIVDNSKWSDNADIFYDPDGEHIYGIYTDQDFFTQEITSKIYVSTDNGNPSTWSNVVAHSAPIKFTIDETQSGEVYYSLQKNIFKSVDFATSFQYYKQLDGNITGLYKKSETEILYASTPLKIYEITPDTMNVIKSLPIPDEVLNYYPLAVGNKWVFDETTVSYDPYPQYSHRILVKDVIGDTIAPNSKHYYIIIDETLWESSVLERVDSSEGKVYRYYEDSTLIENEYLVDDLLAEVGDTVYSSRMGYNMVLYTTILAEESFEKWGLNKPKKVYEQYTLHPLVYSLTQDIGLDSVHSYFDFGDTWTVLKGCIINGTVYGDTTVVSVEDETLTQPTEFSLSQNFPNPFNPLTKIKFTIPVTLSEVEGSLVSLKIYDVLGNEIATLLNEEKSSGSYEIIWSAKEFPSGVYFYQLKAGSFVQTKKMVLLK